MLHVILVDDEPTVLDGMHYIFEKHMPDVEIVATLQNPGDIFPYLESGNVDLVFTDVKMPGMDGIELTEIIHRRYPHIYVVVLSAFQNFDFVRSCLINGAFDYLLKPPSYKAVLDVTRKITFMVSKAQEQDTRIQSAQQITAAFTSSTELPSPWDALKNLQVIALLPDTTKNLRIHDVNSLINIFESIFQHSSYPSYIAGYFLSICTQVIDEGQLQESLENCIVNFKNKGLKPYGTFINRANCTVGLQKVFQLSRRIIEFSIFNELSPVMLEHEYHEVISKTKLVNVCDYIRSKHILRFIVENDRASLINYLADGFQRMFSDHRYLDPENIRVGLSDELVNLSSELKSLDMATLAEETKSVVFPRSRQLVVQWFIENIEKIADQKSDVKLPLFIQQGVEFINRNYMNNITLKDVAEYLHLNPWYISTQLKKHISLGFSEYLSRVRINNAKALLNDGNLKIYQISEMVGFQEPTYFNTVFKKLEGISPKDYQMKICAK